ncbi:E3 ubiquitin-protein ligase RING1-like [Camellia lanceoleosa]|uniref:E3 ubiquitin-protein ligase RING1-like n=1 Tax=Camellia lanceoleosa TaxID=1840588 RepID=A0ACC0J1T9_9ERIC|nr:E3 ubiquitin-protein ligase RING1-like [Camellia lanceoleosa]
MAEVSTSLHFFHQPIINVQEQDSDLYAFDFDHLSPPNISVDLLSVSDSLSDSDPNCFDGAQEDQMIFVTDLFASREEEEFAVDDVHDLTCDVNYRVLDVWSYGEELGLGLGFGSRVESELGEPSSSIRAATDGLRVVGNQSDSDSDSEEVVQDVNAEDPIRDSDIPLFSDCLVFDEQRSGNEELEWEEVDQMVYEGEGLSSVIDRIEELSVSSVVSSNEERYESGEESVWNFEWEVLLAVNNWERAPQFEHESDSDGVSYLAFQDDYTYAAEYDTLFGHFVQNESALKGSPPASKYVVENLLTLVMTKEMLQENMVCAVCKDDILVEEKVARLPCCHHYHGDCIVPWLSIRNTCPVCRYELPTDDLDYKQRKTQTGGLGLSQDLQVRYNFELLP